jgi:hypothetical protein
VQAPPESVKIIAAVCREVLRFRPFRHMLQFIQGGFRILLLRFSILHVTADNLSFWSADAAVLC